MINLHKQNLHKNSRSGFSLLEVLVAVSILLLFLVGPMSIAVQSARSTDFATNQATAFFLAQEGLELAQNARDQYQLEYWYDPTADPTPWADFKADYDDCFTNNGCWLEIRDNSTDGDSYPDNVDVGPCSGSSCQLFIDQSFGVLQPRSRFTYNENSADDKTKFTRSIIMTGGVTAVQVKVIVSWQGDNSISSSKVEMHNSLANIYETP